MVYYYKNDYSRKSNDTTHRSGIQNPLPQKRLHTSRCTVTQEAFVVIPVHDFQKNTSVPTPCRNQWPPCQSIKKKYCYHLWPGWYRYFRLYSENGFGPKNKKLNERISVMKCPHLKKWLTFTCKATDTLYFPSAFQLEEYCKRKEHRKCPFLATRIHREDVGNAIQLTRV